MINDRTILIVDDEEEIRKLFARKLEAAGYHTAESANAAEASDSIAANSPALVITDVSMPGDSGIELLKATQTSHPEIPFLLVTAYANVADAVASLKLGAVDYLPKPVDLEELLYKVQELVPLNPAESEIPTELLNKIIVENPKLHEIYQDAFRVAKSDANVLLNGESGTGKDVMANFIHLASSREKGPFVAVNCAAIPESLIASELVGHIKGAFTGAVQNRKGRFREADGGTLFLDEIGDLPLSLQPALLRAIESGEVTPVGVDNSEKVNVRLLAATNKDLMEEVKEGRFREDLYYRLNVITFEIPPLRERPEDILPLARFFLKKVSQHSPKRLSSAVTRLFMNYDWPGNVRELFNVIERCAILARSELIMPEQLPATIRKTSAKVASNGDLKTLAQHEIEAINQALKQTNGNQTRAAELLGISRRTLINKLNKLK